MPKILIIDDSLLVRMSLKKCFSSNPDYEIHEAEDGVKAVEKFKEISPDLIFCDLTMPNMSGFDAINEMFKISNNAKIVVLTADTQKKTVDKVMAAGAYTVLNKPPKKEQIISIAEELLTNKEQ